MNRITEDDVRHARGPSIWDLGNKTLYSLCRKYPKHDRKDAIVAKVLIIGRSYAAAIERRKNKQESSDNFYEKIVAKKMMKSQIDQWLFGLPDRITNAWEELGQVVAVHEKLTNLFFEITGLKKRALASKYLHFHRPDLFFIYDSRAKSAVTKITPFIRKIPEIQVKQHDADNEYLMFVRRCQWIRDDVKRRFNKRLTPREVDKILLRIADRTKKP